MLYIIFTSFSSWFEPCNCWNDPMAEIRGQPVLGHHGPCPPTCFGSNKGFKSSLEKLVKMVYNMTYLHKNWLICHSSWEWYICSTIHSWLNLSWLQMSIYWMRLLLLWTSSIPEIWWLWSAKGWKIEIWYKISSIPRGSSKIGFGWWRIW